MDRHNTYSTHNGHQTVATNSTPNADLVHRVTRSVRPTSAMLDQIHCPRTSRCDVCSVWCADGSACGALTIHGHACRLLEIWLHNTHGVHNTRDELQIYAPSRGGHLQLNLMQMDPKHTYNSDDSEVLQTRRKGVIISHDGSGSISINGSNNSLHRWEWTLQAQNALNASNVMNNLHCSGAAGCDKISVLYPNGTKIRWNGTKMISDRNNNFRDAMRRRSMDTNNNQTDQNATQTSGSPIATGLCQKKIVCSVCSVCM